LNSNKMTSLLLTIGFSFDVTKKRLHMSDEICRRCMKSVKETLQKEEELKVAKADLLATFFSTTSKFSRNQVANSEAAESGGGHEAAEPGKGAAGAAAASPGPQQQSHHHHHHHHHTAGPNLSHHHMGLYNLTESYRQHQQQQLLLAALPASEMSSLSHKSSGYGPPGGGLVPYYRSRLGLGDSASSCNKSGRGEHTNGGRDCYMNGDSAASSASESRRSGNNVNYFHHLGSGSEYARSEVGSSSFISVSPPRQEYVSAGGGCQQNETESGSLSPRPFDTMSYASTFSLKSCNSTVWPRNGAMTVEGQRRGNAETTTSSHKRRRSASGGDDEEANGDMPSSEGSPSQYRIGGGDGDASCVKREIDEDDEEGRVPPPPAESPMAASPSSGSCTPPSGCSQGDEKAEQEEEEEAARDRRKPWKKRRRVQESNKAAVSNSTERKAASAAGNEEAEGTCGGGGGRTDESNESSNYEDQLDSSNSTPPQSRTPTA
jgi:hypothetical protein